MKAAAIDIGSTTILLATVALRPEGMVKLSDMSEIVRLGEGVKESALLAPGSMERAVETVRRYRRIAEDSGVDEIFVVATAAVREARNRTDFLAMVEKGTGLAVRILSGEEEAWYTYLSVRSDEKGQGGTFSIVDLGGGSTEIIKGDPSRLLWSVSLSMGAASLTELFIRHDPPRPEELEDMRRYIDGTLAVSLQKGENARIRGIGGTVTNCASLILRLERFDAKAIEGTSLSVGQIDDVIDTLVPMTVEERRRSGGMEKERADLLPQGLILLRGIMEWMGCRALKVNTGGLRYGLLYEALLRHYGKW